MARASYPLAGWGHLWKPEMQGEFFEGKPGRLPSEGTWTPITLTSIVSKQLYVLNSFRQHQCWGDSGEASCGLGTAGFKSQLCHCKSDPRKG